MSVQACTGKLSTGELCAKKATSQFKGSWLCDDHGDQALLRDGIDFHWARKP